MKKILPFFAIIAALYQATTASGQVWPAWIQYFNVPGTYNTEFFKFMVPKDGFLYLGGETQSPATLLDYLVVKYNLDGMVQWYATYDGPAHGEDRLWGLAVDDDANVYVTGESRDDGVNDIATIKFDSNGNQIWCARHDTAVARGGVAVDGMGNVYVAGSDDDMITIKYNSAGQEQWLARFAGTYSGYDAAADIEVGSDGFIYMTGCCWMDTTLEDWITIKYSPSGGQLWLDRFYAENGLYGDQPIKLLIDERNFIYVTGYAQRDATYEDYATIKYSPEGMRLWMAYYATISPDADQATDMTVDTEGNVCVTGWSTVPYWYWADYATIKYDSDGNELWSVRWDGGPYPNPFDDVAKGIDVDASGNVFVTGTSQQLLGPAQNMMTLKYAPNGLQLWGTPYANLSAWSDNYFDIAVDDSDYVYVAGEGHTSLPSGNDFLLIKYTQTCPLDIFLTAISPPIQIPPAGGNFDFNIALSNNASSAQNFDLWIMLQMPSGAWHGPMLGPIALTLPAGGSIERLRTQNIPGRAPAGIYTYRGYVGDYPSARWDSSSFTFEKAGAGDWGLGISDWDNSGQSLDENDGAFIIHHSSFIIPSVSPNPFNAITVASFEMRDASYVRLRIYDTAGRLMETLVDGWREAGHYDVPFDGSHLPSGIYLYRIKAGQYSASGKMLLLK